MNAVLPPSSQGILDVDDLIAPVSTVTEYSLSEEELDQLLKDFAEHCEKLDAHLTEKEETRNFELFYDAIREALQEVGIFSENKGDDDADFIAPRHVDASRTLRVIAHTLVTPEIANRVLEAFEELGSEHAVLFTGRHGRRVVLSNGDFCREE